LLILRLLVPLLLFIVPAGAQVVYTGIETSVFSNSTAHVSITMTFSSSGEKEFGIPVYYRVSNLKTSSNFQSASCRLEYPDYGSQILCKANPGQVKREMKIEFDVASVKNVNGAYLFKFDYYIPMDTNSLWVRVSLPEGMVLVRNHTAFQPYSPPDGVKTTDGRRIFVSWTRSNVTSGDIFSVQVVYESTTRYSEFPVYLFAFGILVVLALFGFRAVKSRDMKILFPILKSDEKLVMEILLRHGGRANQKTIVSESNYSKAKISKVLKSLEERGLVRLERIGRTNKVYISGDYKKLLKSSKPEKKE